jgi:hypothetical protein
MTDTYEARGPHLPDVLTRQAPWVYLFVAAALIHLGAAWLDWAGRGPLAPPQDLMTILGDRTQSVLVSLFGAALFIRHPDARRSLPLIAFGLGLMALGPLLTLIDAPITRFIDSLAPAGDEFVGTSPAVVAYHVFTSLVGIAAVIYVGVGLAIARRRPIHPAERSLTVVIAIVGIATVVLPYALVPLRLPTTPFEWALIAIGLVLSLLHALAWSYVIAVAFGAWMAGEAPRLGWGLALLASVLGLVLRILGAMVFVIGNLAGGLSQAALAAMGLVGTAGWALLLAAFAVGLPATDDPPEATQPGSAAG